MVRRLNALLEEARQLCNTAAPDIHALGRLLSHIPAATDQDEQRAGLFVLWSYIHEALDPDVFAKAHQWAWCRLLLPHTLWVARGDSEAPARPGRDLSQVDLGGADLSWAELPMTRLDYANLSGADLRGANLREASLRHTNLTQARLQGAPLPQSAVALLPSSSAFEQRDDEVRYSLQGASLSIAMDDGFDDALSLEGSELSQTNLAGADLTCARLAQADLRGANLEEALLRGANLQGADLRGADLSCADLRGATLKGASLLGANFFWSNLAGADLRGALLEGANFEGADFEGADLTGTRLIRNNLCGARLTSVRWDLGAGAPTAGLGQGDEQPTSGSDEPLSGCVWDQETRWPEDETIEA